MPLMHPGSRELRLQCNSSESLTSKEGRPAYGKLADVIAACLANNLLEVRDEARAKGQVWYVLFLNRLLCVRFDLPFAYSGWRPVSPAQLVRWSESGYRADAQLDMALDT